MRQTKLTQAARRRKCQVRITGEYNGNREIARKYHAERVRRGQVQLLRERLVSA